MGGGPVAEGAAAARDEQRRDESATDRDRVVADGIDAPMDRPQPPGPEADLDRATSEPERGELRAAHDSTLASGQPGDPLVGRILCTLCMRVMVNVHSAGHGTR